MRRLADARPPENFSVRAQPEAEFARKKFCRFALPINLVPALDHDCNTELLQQVESVGCHRMMFIFWRARVFGIGCTVACITLSIAFGSVRRIPAY